VSGNTRIVMNDDGVVGYVTSLYLTNIQAGLTFAAPSAQPQAFHPGAPDLTRQNSVSGDSAASEGGLFMSDNPRSQAVPHAAARAVSLAACKVVEQEFARTDPVRPRLTLFWARTP